MIPSGKNAAKERIKRRYFTFLEAAKRQSEASIDAASEAIARFEAFSGYTTSRRFRCEAYPTQAAPSQRWSLRPT